MMLSNLFLSWKTQMTLSGKEERSCGKRGWGVPREASLPLGRLMLEVTEYDREGGFSEDKDEAEGELGPEGSDSVRAQSSAPG